MQHNKSYYSNTNSHDNTFNFGNQLDISNGKKDKTGEMFFKQAYDFDDFQNIGDDKTVKSSNYKAKKGNLSNIQKKEGDQLSSKVIGNSILNDLELSGNGFKTNKILDQSINKALSEKQNYPKFGQRKFSADPNQQRPETAQQADQYNTQSNMFNFKNSQLSYTKSNAQVQETKVPKTQFKVVNIQPIQNRPLQASEIQSFRKKNVAYYQSNNQQGLIDRQEQYKQLMAMINFYKNQAQKINYERTLLQEESIKEMLNMANSQLYEEQMRNNLDQINHLNQDIEKEKAIEKKLTRVVSQLEEEYNQIIESVNEMDFKRPAIIKDQAKVLIDQINQLKSQFQALQRDNGSLNLSCTIPALTLNSVQNRLAQSKSQNFNQPIINTPQQQSLEAYICSTIQQIHTYNSVSEDPQFLKNLKLCCLKDEWTIFTNKQIIVSIDYKSCPLIKIRIGNKTNRLLKRFNMQIGVKDVSVKYMENQVVNRKAFLLQGIKVDPSNLPEVFVKVKLSYQVQCEDVTKEESKEIKLFCPTGLLNFGQFTPLTFKQFQTELALPLPMIQSSFRPIDKTLINSISQILLLLPNLKKIQSDQTKAFGLFMSVFNEGTLILIEESLGLLKIKLKNGNRSLLKLLQFILTA